MNTTLQQLDDDPEFQKAIVELGKAMWIDRASGQVLLSHWQGINWMVYKWQEKLLIDKNTEIAALKAQLK